MIDLCKTCGNPIYPPGITYTGISCYYQGNHPSQTSTAYISINSELVQAIKELTKAINKQAIENYLTKVYGERCKSKDIDDLLELKEPGNYRCLTCKVWEHYDEEVKGEN